MTAIEIKGRALIRTAMGPMGAIKHLFPVCLMFCLLWASHPVAVHGQGTETTKVVFGAREDTSPFAYREGTEFKGYTIDLCYRIFDRYKRDKGNATLELEIIPVNATSRFEALKKGRIQALCGATTVTVARMKDHHFTLLTYLSGAGVMKRRGTKVEALQEPRDHEGVRVSVVAQTTTEAHVKELLGVSVTVVEQSNHAAAFNALQEGKADFYFGDRMILRERLRKTPDRGAYRLAPGFLSYEPYAIAIHKDNDELLQAANAALAALYRSGEIKNIYQRWFGSTQMSDLLNAMYEIQKIPE